MNRKLFTFWLAAIAILALALSAPAAQDAAKKKGKGKKKAGAAAATAPKQSTEPPVAMPMTDETGFTKIFDGKTLEGWEGDPAVWSVKDGAIVGKANMITANNFVNTKKEYGNFVLRVQVKLVDQKGNTGVQFRSIKIPGTPSMAGFQADFADEVKYCGMLYDEKRRGIMLMPNPAAIKLKPGDWNDIEVVADGNHIQIALNEVRTVDYTETMDKDPKTGQEIWKKGFIGLQAHAGKVMEVQFRNIRIKELNK